MPTNDSTQADLTDKPRRQTGRQNPTEKPDKLRNERERKKMAATSKNSKKSSDSEKALKLSKTQLKILKFIEKFTRENNYPPAFREIGENANLKSLSSVHYQIKVLADKGYLAQDERKSRAVKMLRDSKGRPFEINAALQNIESSNATNFAQNSVSSAISPSADRHNADRRENKTEADRPGGTIAESRDIPLVGRIAAGSPVSAIQHTEDVMRLPERLTGTGNLFMLEVHGDSMINAAICDGDFVVIREQNEAKNGDIVAALLDDEATVKTYKNEHGHVWLLPQNTAYAPIDGTHARIMGKVVTVLRKL